MMYGDPMNDPAMTDPTYDPATDPFMSMPNPEDMMMAQAEFFDDLKGEIFFRNLLLMVKVLLQKLHLIS